MAMDPTDEEPTYTDYVSGTEVLVWFSKDYVEDSCPVCKTGQCVQKVMRSADWDGDLIVHNDPKREFH